MQRGAPAEAASPPLERLKRRPEFLHAAQKGKRAARPGLVLQAVPNGRDALRVGFTVTKKVGNSVTRNRAKRRLREAARLGLAGHPLKGYDLVLIGREGTLTRTFDRLRSDLAGALAQVTPSGAQIEAVTPSGAQAASSSGALAKAVAP